MAATASTATRPSLTKRVEKFIPILSWGPKYDKKWLQPDLLAGVTVAAFSVPENMAYASLAGLGPEFGMYASLLALIAYAVFGTSRQLSVGVTSALSIMVAGTLGAMAFTDSSDYAAAAGFVAIVAGGIALLAGIFRLGFVVNFISESVLVGFSAGAALFIGSSQIAKLFGIDGVQGNFFERMGNVLRNLDQTNYWCLAMGLISIAALLFFEIKLPRLPGALIVVVAAIIVMQVSDLMDRGLEVAGTIPSGLPGFAIPTIDPSNLSTLLGLGFGLFLLSYIEGIGAARTFASAHKYKIDANQELIANGAANISAGLFHGYNVGGSMSRSAVNDDGGAKSPAASLFAAVILAVVLLFLTKPFSYLPEATLAAVVLVAVKSLVKMPAIERLRMVSRADFLAALFTFLGVLIFGMLEGIIIGVLFSFLILLMRVSSPHTSLLGRKPNTSEFVDMTRHPDADRIPNTLIFRVDSGLFYANAPVVKDALLADIAALDTPPDLVVMDMATVPLTDLGAVDTLREIKEELDGRNIDIRFANVYSEVKSFIEKVEGAGHLGHINADESVDEVLAEWQKDKKPPRILESSHAGGK